MDEAAPPAEGFPPTKEPWAFPPELLAHWVNIPEDQEMTFAITRRIIDHLFFSLNHMTLAQAHLDVALIAYSNGDLDTANQRLLAGRENTVDALDNARKMLSEIMSKATGVAYDRGS